MEKDLILMGIGALILIVLVVIAVLIYRNNPKTVAAVKNAPAAYKSAVNAGIAPITGAVAGAEAAAKEAVDAVEKKL
jgi:hypothetical protein